MDQNQPARRPHYHRGRRGPDRRGSDRRAGAAPETGSRPGDQVDVEQIMRDIRARIAQRSGIELSTQQIQELAARRLEAVLDPRSINPSLMQQLRRGASTAPEIAPPASSTLYSFEADTLYESHRGLLRFIRRLLNPLLKLFFNPTPLIQALNTQARLNREAAAREAERERIQMEWNALHYEIVQRLVTEVSRVSVEMQALTLRVESLAARLDFNDRRLRAIDASAGAVAPQRQPARPTLEAPASAASSQGEPAAAAEAAGTETGTGEGSRRRRRRRRGRRGGAAADAAAVAAVGGEGLTGPDTVDLAEGDDGEDDEGTAAAGPAAPQETDGGLQEPVEAVETLETVEAAAEAFGPSSETTSISEPSSDLAPVSSVPPDTAANVATDTGSDTGTDPGTYAFPGGMDGDAARDEELPVREGLAQGAGVPPPEEEPVPPPVVATTSDAPAAAEAPTGTDVLTAAEPSAGPAPATAEQTPPPDEPAPPPVPPDPGPPDR